MPAFNYRRFLEVISLSNSYIVKTKTNPTNLQGCDCIRCILWEAPVKISNYWNIMRTVNVILTQIQVTDKCNLLSVCPYSTVTSLWVLIVLTQLLHLYEFSMSLLNSYISMSSPCPYSTVTSLWVFHVLTQQLHLYEFSMCSCIPITQLCCYICVLWARTLVSLDLNPVAVQ